MMFIDNLPNPHPAVSHFPIALIAVGVLLDLASVVADRGWLDRAAAVLYGIGAAGAVGAFLTGRQAAEAVDVPGEALGTLTDHEDIALVVLVVVVPLAIIRGVLAWRDRSEESLSLRPFRAILVITGVVATGLVLYTANLGGKLVFEHGLGVEQEPEVITQTETVEVEVAAQDDERPDVDPEDRYHLRDDTIDWHPIAADQEALTSVLTFAQGSPEDTVETLEPGDDIVEPGLSFEVDGEALVEFDETYGDVQVDVELELIDYEGAFGPAHHIQDFEQFERFEFTDDGHGDLIRRSDGEEESLDDGVAEDVPAEVFELTVSASGRHFYGRLDGNALAHGHAAPEPDGGVGLYFDGEGTVRIHSVTVSGI